METQTQGDLKVEDLKNFPFDSYSQFRKAYANNEIEVGVDKGVAVGLSARGFCSKNTYIKTRLTLWVAVIVVLAFIIPTILMRHWLLLLTLPLYGIAVYFLAKNFITISASKDLLSTISKNEHLLCVLWKGRGASIKFTDGRTFHSYMGSSDENKIDC